MPHGNLQSHGASFFGDPSLPLRLLRVHREALIVTEFVLPEIAGQIAAARAAIERHLGTTLNAIHLFGSALDGGLKPRSDIDLLVKVAARPDET
ncbi:nucleotidyltransferase domain-containing protein, partial [Burkholderia pseudomallei]|uniref:nucleotidyltransferase domain-containing protein n=1 Tax=Burkholderia pseudomallei TaxID=28450 RepID=UPI001EEE8E2C